MEVTTIKSHSIQALEWYNAKMGIYTNGGVSDEFIKKAKSEYKKHLQKVKFDEAIKKKVAKIAKSSKVGLSWGGL